jgi:hypothetical protein
MTTFVLIALIALAGIAFVAWIIDTANRQKLEADRQREQRKLEAKRRTEEAIRIVQQNAPELAAIRKAVTVLRDFVASANAYRPNFSFPFDVLFPRDCEGSGDGPDPEPWLTTVDNLLVPKAHELHSIYTKCMYFFNPPAPPEYPQVELPLSGVKTVEDGAGKKLLVLLRKLFAFQLSRHWKLQEATNQLQSEFGEQNRMAEDAKDSIDFWKKNYELERDQQLAPIMSVRKEYATHTRNGIQGHFQLALRTLALPIPSNFPWSTFYDPNERLIQINQRVPFIADVVVKRPDSNRPPAKKDTDNFLRRLVPAVSLHIARHVAVNDLCEDVDPLPSIAGADISNAQLVS